MSTLSEKLNSLVIFRPVALDRTMRLLDALDRARDAERGEFLAAYCDFASDLLSRAPSLDALVADLLEDDDNAYVRRLCAGMPTDHLEDALDRELDTLSQIAAYDGGDLRALPENAALAPWTAAKRDFRAEYRARIGAIPRKGYGIWAKYHVFRLDESGNVLPVREHDPQTLASLYGYDAERAKIIANTEALLCGAPHNNVLLYGDAGTGKSSTVKAIANEYADRGLRLIELDKDGMHRLPSLLGELAAEPLKFILFIDDLTFSSDDRDFCTLKAILEGGVSRPGDNTAVYVTSNHRHLVKETGADRQGDDLFVADTLQEIISLSARFGLTVNFMRPDKDLYCEIVRSLARDEGLEADDHALTVRAEAFAIRHGGRNPRTAKQFIAACMIEENG